MTLLQIAFALDRPEPDRPASRAELLVQAAELVADAWQDQRIRDGAGRGTVAGEILALRAAWAWGAEVGIVADVLPRARLRAKRTRPKPTPDRDEIAALIAWVVENCAVAWPPRLIRLLAATGARIGEVQDLRWGAIDLDRRLIRVSGKTGPRVVPLTAATAAEIASWGPGEEEARVWGVGPARARTGTQDLLARASAALGLPPYSPHALRRAAVDALYESGAEIGAIAKVLGHSTQTALRYYRQPREASLRAAVEAADLGALPAHRAGAQRRKVLFIRRSKA